MRGSAPVRLSMLLNDEFAVNPNCRQAHEAGWDDDARRLAEPGQPTESPRPGGGGCVMPEARRGAQNVRMDYGDGMVSIQGPSRGANLETDGFRTPGRQSPPASGAAD